MKNGGYEEAMNSEKPCAASWLLRAHISMVPKKGLEPPHPCEYVDLNHARLPIPPLRHETQFQRISLKRQHL